MKRLICMLLALQVAGWGFFQSGTAELQNKLSASLGMDVSEAVEMAAEDSHGGFHGDGMTFAVYRFGDDTVRRSVEESGNWKPLPLTENLTALLYGRETAEGRIGPYLAGADGEPLFPQVTNGFYYFLDRHAQSADSRSDAEVLNRASLNVTVALYDADSNTLYYAELDT